MKDSLYDKTLAAHPQCPDPGHPGCPVCEPEHNWECLRLLPEFDKAYKAFVDKDYCCSCHSFPPCGYCTDEGNPMNLLEDDSVWEMSTDVNLTSREWLSNNS